MFFFMILSMPLLFEFEDQYINYQFFLSGFSGLLSHRCQTLHASCSLYIHVLLTNLDGRQSILDDLSMIGSLLPITFGFEETNRN